MVNERAIALADAHSGGARSPASATSCRRTDRSRCSSIRCGPTTTRCCSALEREAGRADAGRRGRTPRRCAFRSATAASSGPTSSGVAAFARRDAGRGHRAARGADLSRLHARLSCPGFAYMGLVDARIAAPRRATPRVRVPGGSVGIAGVQTGIYPAETPGGWQLVGRTPVRPFDPRARRAVSVEGRRRGAVLSHRSRASSSGCEACATEHGVAARASSPGLLTTFRIAGRWG